MLREYYNHCKTIEQIYYDSRDSMCQVWHKGHCFAIEYSCSEFGSEGEYYVFKKLPSWPQNLPLEDKLDALYRNKKEYLIDPEHGSFPERYLFLPYRTIVFSKRLNKSIMKMKYSGKNSVKYNTRQGMYYDCRNQLSSDYANTSRA